MIALVELSSDSYLLIKFSLEPDFMERTFCKIIFNKYSKTESMFSFDRNPILSFITFFNSKVI